MDLYFLIKEQRKSIKAPVDTMGCCSVGDSPTAEERKFQILVALLLSSQTKDEVTYAAVSSLRLLLGGLTPKNILKCPETDLHKCLEKVGYHNKKLKFLLEISKRVQKEMPSTLEDVLKLPGIGRKMAYLYLFHGCNKNEGIGVDTHVHRISNRIGLVNSKTPEESRVQLESKMPKEEWQELNTVMVGFGQRMCLPVNPKCSSCIVRDRCPSSRIPKGSV